MQNIRRQNPPCNVACCRNVFRSDILSERVAEIQKNDTSCGRIVSEDRCSFSAPFLSFEFQAFFPRESADGERVRHEAIGNRFELSVERPIQFGFDDHGTEADHRVIAWDRTIRFNVDHYVRYVEIPLKKSGPDSILVVEHNGQPCEGGSLVILIGRSSVLWRHAVRCRSIFVWSLVLWVLAGEICI